MKAPSLISLCVLLYLCASGGLRGQDTHFSQFFFSPQWLSPAELGSADAQYRVVANQKTQWRAVTQPYTTFALGLDGRPDFLPENMAAGIAIMNDRAGDSRFNTFSVLLGSSYRYSIDAEGVHQLNAGLQAGLSQVSIDPNNLRWDRQFNGVLFDPNLPTGENIARNNRLHLNLNLGLSYTYTPSQGTAFTAGWASHNLSQPDRSFYNDTGVDLPMRHSFYITGYTPITDVLDLMPAFRYMQQGPFSEWMVGTSLRRVMLNERSMYRAVFAGYYGRISDAGVGLAGVEIDDWRLALSYDINFSNLQVASRYRGGFEFSVQYLINRYPRNAGYQHRYCPSFL